MHFVTPVGGVFVLGCLPFDWPRCGQLDVGAVGYSASTAFLVNTPFGGAKYSLTKQVKQ